MSYTNPREHAGDVGAAPHDLETMALRLPDAEQLLLPGVQAGATLTALVNALAQPAPADPDRVSPMLGVTGSHVAYAWRDAANQIHLDAAGNDRPVALSEAQAAALAEDLAVWVVPAEALVIPPQRSRK